MPDVTPFVFRGYTTHARLSPVFYRFKYPIFMIGITPAVFSNPIKPPFLSLNQFNLFSIYDTDYLTLDNTPIFTKLSSFMPPCDTVILVTMPRVLFKAFRPVHFYLGIRDNTICKMVAEVSNTYHERHVYAMNQIKQNGNRYYFSSEKQFHVSPFFDESGIYHFCVNFSSTELSITIEYFQQNKRVFWADISGTRFKLCGFELLKTAILFPFNSILVMPRILWHAFNLYFKKKLAIRSKPMPSSTNTIRPMPMNWFQRYLFSKLDTILNAAQDHRLILKLPDGTAKTYGNISDEDIEPAEISIHHFWVLRELFLKGEIGLGESFMKQYWTTPNITAVISFFIRNKAYIGTHFQPSFWVKNYMAFLHFLNRNTVKKAAKNIKSHYDIGNEFYSLFLDKSKQYSSGIFKTPTASLEDAQAHKIQTILTKLALSDAHHLLEIGSGWGELAIRAAQQFGCRVTTITLSEEQAAYINQRLSALSLTHLVEVKIMDFRNISETYDRIVSIEMIEAVGHGFLPVYFEKIKSALKPNGIVVIQAITYPHDEYNHYLKRSDFIRKHIFPGGHLPSLEIIKSLVNTHKMSLTALEDITDSYATTLAHWYTRFMSKVTQIKSLGFDDSFVRKWAFYFNYCEAAFRTKYLSTYQLIIRK